MKPGTITHTLAVLLSSITSVFSQSVPIQMPFAKAKLSKKTEKESDRKDEKSLFFTPVASSATPPPSPGQTHQFAWRTKIVTTVFWIGERPTANNPTPNHASAWDRDWAKNYGGYDTPDRSQRRDLIPANFTPKQNPFYIALPYNDKSRMGHRPEASKVVPWFREAYQGPGVSTCKGRWVAIRKGSRTAYAQWEDTGPFRTDHWQYVFGNERPKPNLNKGAGLDVSPAVRDFLDLQDTDVTDWKFVDFKDVPPGPWARYGDNNTFVMNQRKGRIPLAQIALPPARIQR